ncbi:MAG: NUDIX domain-containing protein [Butyrivibrio sp.]|nr:NUDIX domain-containing protein [Butyrivibrio sp.]
MATIIKAKELIIKGEDDMLELPMDVREDIAAYWREQTKLYPGMFNGPVYSVLNMENNDGNVVFECALSDYANYKYSEAHDLGQFACRNLYAGCLLKTSDGKCIVSLNGVGSEFTGKIQFIGGAVDPEDRDEVTNHLDPLITAMRELEEEVGTQIRNSIEGVGETHIITNEKKFGILTILQSELTADELLAAFEHFKESTHNNEIDCLFAFGKDNKDELEEYENRQDIGVVEFLRSIL